MAGRLVITMEPFTVSAGKQTVTATGEAGASSNELTCEICGAQMVQRQCKITCPNCGFTRDCSDP